VVTNISEDEHFSLGEFYKMPKQLADIDVSMDEHSAQKQEKSIKTYGLSEICQKERFFIFYEKGQVDGEWKNL
jgi:hypothetical protein